MATKDPLRPDAGLLAKIGSILVHADEMLSPDGHAFDQHALRGLLADQDVKDWVARMTRIALVPRKRTP